MFLTASQEITLKKYGKELLGETKQMRKRVKYLELFHEIPEEQRKAVKDACAHCSARVYLDGRDVVEAVGAAQASSFSSGSAAEPRAPKRPRTTADCLKELMDLKALTDAGLLSAEEAQALKAKLLAGD